MIRHAPEVGAFVLLLLAAAAWPQRAAAQGADSPIPTRQTRFWIPFVPEGAIQRLQKVELHYSSDQGRTWRLVETVAPNSRGFQFYAERDGVYWFAVRTIDVDNRFHPQNLQGQPPGLVVCVDTTPPAVRLSPLAPQDGVGVEWDIRDDYLDLSSLRLEWRGPGGTAWQPLQIDPTPSGRRTWQAGTAVIDELRLQVRDRAGNVGEAHTSLSGRRTETPGYSSPPPGGQASPPVRLVNSKQISINYRVEDKGASGVSLELWWTRDSGRTWQKCLDQLPEQPPCTVTAPDEGLYGFTLVARSGVNLGDRPPQPGEPPQVWVEVDLKLPQVRLTSVEVGRGPDANKMTIRWTAFDKNLDERSVKLEYAPARREPPYEKEGQWTEIAAGLPRDGEYVWLVPTDGVRYYVRAVARDRANNVGMAESQKPVVVDLSRPRGIIMEVGPVQGPTSGGGPLDAGNSITVPRSGGRP